MFSTEWFNQVLTQNHAELCQAHCQYLALLRSLTLLCEDIKVYLKWSSFLLQEACVPMVHQSAQHAMPWTVSVPKLGISTLEVSVARKHNTDIPFPQVPLFCEAVYTDSRHLIQF